MSVTRKLLGSALPRVALVAALALGLASCSKGPSLEGGSYTGFATGRNSSEPGVSPASQASSKEVAKIFDEYSVPEADEAPADYRLAPMDVVEVNVYGAEDLKRDAQVSAAGYITLPLIKDVKAAGRTTDQLQKDIAAKLERDFMQSPQVFVSVKEYNSQRVTVDGAVAKPGVIPLKTQTTLAQVIAEAGGISEMGSASSVYILRKKDGKKMAARFDLNEIRKGKKPDPVMIAGDIVMVDESGGKVMMKNLREMTAFTGVFSLLML